MGSVLVAQGLSCSQHAESSQPRGRTPCPLHWQVDSYPLRRQGSLHTRLKMDFAVVFKVNRDL